MSLVCAVFKECVSAMRDGILKPSDFMRGSRPEY